jgi:hypothetical protein
MKKLVASEVLKALQESSGDADILAQKLGVSKSHAYYLIRNKQSASNPQTLALLQDTPAETTEQVNIVRSEIDFSAFIPPIDTDYKQRQVDVDIERYAETKSTAILLIGEAGSGKTYSIQQYAAKKGLPFLRVACDDSVALKDLLGRKEIKQGTTFFKFGLLLEFLQKPGVILFDEFNALPGGKLFFLHEILDKLTDGRRVFIKEADSVITLDKECRIFLACNPNSAKYSGTNKTNVALVDRTLVLPFEAFTPADVPAFFDTGNAEVTKALKNYYTEARKLIQDSSMRVVFSLRSVKRIASRIKAGDPIDKALAHNFYNMALLTASENEKEQLESLAKVCFGLSIMGGNKQ